MSFPALLSYLPFLVWLQFVLKTGNMHSIHSGAGGGGGRKAKKKGGVPKAGVNTGGQKGVIAWETRVPMAAS